LSDFERVWRYKIRKNTIHRFQGVDAKLVIDLHVRRPKQLSQCELGAKYPPQPFVEPTKRKSRGDARELKTHPPDMFYDPRGIRAPEIENMSPIPLCLSILKRERDELIKIEKRAVPLVRILFIEHSLILSVCDLH
jgi:hypothetical protein